MMKFRLFLLSFFFFTVLTIFAEGNKNKTAADTLKIVPAVDSVLGDSILVAPADTNAVQTQVDSTVDSVERKGFLALWVMIAILTLLVFTGYRFRHKDK